MVPSTVKLLHCEKEGKIYGDQEGCRIGLKPAPDKSDNSTGKGTSGTDMFSSKVHRVHMELGGKLPDSLIIKTQFLKRLQSVSVVDGAAHIQKDNEESNGGSLEKNVADIFVLFFCGVQLVLRSGVLTVLDLNEVDVTPRFAEVFGSVLSGVDGSAGGWRAVGVLPVSLSCPLPLRRTHVMANYRHCKV